MRRQSVAPRREALARGLAFQGHSNRPRANTGPFPDAMPPGPARMPNTGSPGVPLPSGRGLAIPRSLRWADVLWLLRTFASGGSGSGSARGGAENAEEWGRPIRVRLREPSPPSAATAPPRDPYHKRRQDDVVQGVSSRQDQPNDCFRVTCPPGASPHGLCEHLLRVWSTGFSRRKPSQPKRLRFDPDWPTGWLREPSPPSAPTAPPREPAHERRQGEVVQGVSLQQNTLKGRGRFSA
jgi:hypothetical protein